MTDPTQTPRTPETITQEKRDRREETIEKVQALLAESFRRGMESKGRGGMKTKQKWFSISASLAQSLARLVSELEYEKLRLELDAMKKRAVEQNVTRSRVSFPQIEHGMARKEPSEHAATGDSH